MATHHISLVNCGRTLFDDSPPVTSPATGPTTQAVADQLVAGNHLSYVYLGRGLSLTSVTPTTIVAYEIPLDSNSGANLLFGDGHVEFDDAAFISKVIGKAAAGQFPVTIPTN
jgi:prepilin-type processing-associated H-X9-DG protein